MSPDATFLLWEVAVVCVLIAWLSLLGWTIVSSNGRPAKVFATTALVFSVATVLATVVMAFL